MDIFKNNDRVVYKVELTRHCIKRICVIALIIALYFAITTSSVIHPNYYEFMLSGNGGFNIKDFQMNYSFESHEGNVSFSVSEMNGLEDTNNVYLRFPRQVTVLDCKYKNGSLYKNCEINGSIGDIEVMDNVTEINFYYPINKTYFLKFKTDMEPRGTFDVYIDRYYNTVQSGISLYFGNSYRCNPNCFETINNTNFVGIPFETEAKIELQRNENWSGHTFQISMENYRNSIIKTVAISLSISLGVAFVSMMYSDASTKKHLNEEVFDFNTMVSDTEKEKIQTFLFNTMTIVGILGGFVLLKNPSNIYLGLLTGFVLSTLYLYYTLYVPMDRLQLFKHWILKDIMFALSAICFWGIIVIPVVTSLGPFFDPGVLNKGILNLVVYIFKIGMYAIIILSPVLPIIFFAYVIKPLFQRVNKVE